MKLADKEEPAGQAAKRHIAEATSRKELNGLISWSRRLTLILIGTCILFSLFFSLEFLVARLFVFAGQKQASSHHLSRSSEPESGKAVDTCTVRKNNTFKRLLWLCSESSSATCDWKNPVAESDTNYRLRDEPDFTLRTEDRSSSKLGVNFDLLYEQKGNSNNNKNKLSPHHERLARLLLAHHRAMPFNPNIWMYSKPSKWLPEYLSGNPEDCLRDLSWIQREVDAFLSLRKPFMDSLERKQQTLMELLDSFGRPEAGTLTGHPFWLGSYLQCKKLTWFQESSSTTERHQQIKSTGKTRYCIGKLSLNSWSPQHDSETFIKLGLCLPDSCDSLALFKASLPDEQNQVSKPRDEEASRMMMMMMMNASSASENIVHITTSRSSSSSRLVNEIREKIQQILLYNFAPKLYPAGSIMLTDVYCLPREQNRQLSAGAFLLLLALISWLCAVACCTWVRRVSSASQKADESSHSGTGNSSHLKEEQSLVDLLAADENFQRLFSFDSTRQLEGEEEESLPVGKKFVDLSVLDCFKHCGCVGVIAAHVLLAYLSLGTSYSHTLNEIGTDLRTMLLLSLNNVVDTFFVISGLLAGYLILSRSRTNTGQLDSAESRNIVKRGRKMLKMYANLLLARYLRLAPLYFLVYAYAKYLATHLGSGPLWDYATSDESLRGLCKQESWIWPIAFASDFKPISHHCVPPAWSIAADLHFFILLPPLVGLLKRSARTAKLLIGVMILASSLYAIHDYSHLLEYVSKVDFSKLRLHVFTVLIRYAAHAYSQPQNRFGPLLIGLLGGHALHQYHTFMLRGSAGSKRAHYWPGWMRGPWFAGNLLLALLLMVAPALVQLRERIWPTESTDSSQVELNYRLALIGLVLIKPLWSLSNCLLFLRLTTDLRATFVARFMSLRFWRILSKLNYAILLIHFELIAYESMSQLSLQPITWRFLLTKFTFAYLCSLLCAIPLCALFELPVHRLATWWLKRIR